MKSNFRGVRIMSAKFNFRPERVTGEHGNAWNNELTGATGVSNVVDIGHCTNVSMFGHVDGDSEIDFYISQNGVNFFK